jgi:hypothetical protein
MSDILANIYGCYWYFASLKIDDEIIMLKSTVYNENTDNNRDHCFTGIKFITSTYYAILLTVIIFIETHMNSVSSNSIDSNFYQFVTTSIISTGLPFIVIFIYVVSYLFNLCSGLEKNSHVLVLAYLSFLAQMSIIFCSTFLVKLLEDNNVCYQVQSTSIIILQISLYIVIITTYLQNFIN